MYKHDYDKKLFRLINILAKLYRGESFTIDEIAQEYGVSNRTIQRDLNERLIHFPIYQENNVWKMDTHKFTDDFLVHDKMVA